MIVPKSGVDDFGQEAIASITFLRYALTIAYRPDSHSRSMGTLEILKEELSHIKIGDAHQQLLFPHKATTWRKSAVQGERRVPFFISTDGTGANRVIKLHQDGGSSGRPLSRPAVNLPRTILSGATAAESPTTLLARREMQSWRLLQLEPSALRKPDEYTAPTRLGADGSHLPATLYHLTRTARTERRTPASGERIYAQVVGRLSELINDVFRISVDRDERRQLLTLEVTDRNGTRLPARALSDGTLRFLALAVLELEPESSALICLEEPENGIHPSRIQAMIRLLQDIATDVNMAIGPDNPLRQVIINTHSPLVVQYVPADSLLVAQLRDTVREGRHFSRVTFSAMPDTWRQSAPDATPPFANGKLLDYLSTGAQVNDPLNGATRAKKSAEIRVIDRPDVQQMLLPGL